VIKRCDVIQKELNDLLSGFSALAVDCVFKAIRREIACTKPKLVQSERIGFKRLAFPLQPSFPLVLLFEGIAFGRHVGCRKTVNPYGSL
jgi:hypothetical protein